MKKIVKSMVLTLSLLLLVACGKTNYTEKLQENDWQMVSVDSSDVLEISFASETAVIKSDFFSRSANYKIEDNNVITLSFDDETLIYEIEERDKNELLFKDRNEENEEDEEDIILIPLEQNNE